MLSSLSSIIRVYDVKSDNFTGKNTKKSINLSVHLDNTAVSKFKYIRIYRIYYKDLTEQPTVEIATEL
ncbi:hypothetical protein [Intestinibacter sp.]|uniref:hypothetical protein n=1 Tax=Intestinibacter sp. TaxID=1965304 RepID=UPI003F1764AA